MRYFSVKSYIAIIFVVVIITIVATFILSSLVSSEVQEVSRDIARRSFQKKYEHVRYQLNQLQKPLSDAKRIITQGGGEKQVLEDLNMLSTLQVADSMVVNTWFYVGGGSGIRDIHTNSRNGKGRILPDSTITALAESPQNTHSEIVRDDKGRYLWRNRLKARRSFGTVYYGYDLELKAIQRLFWDIDTYSLSYAYVFSGEGTCLVHPEMAYIGKNVFEFIPVIPEDTLLQEHKFNERLVESEFLKLDVIRYIQPFYIGGEKYYIAVNFPKSINEQDINKIKKYSFAIYFISTGLLLFVFYFFTRAIRNEFREKELLQKDKASLALEKEVFQKESASLQLQQLKKQMNPHFLFNSLNALYTLIDQDQDLSKKFTLKLSNLYRYLVQSPRSNIAKLEFELNFIREYMFLQGIRFGNKLEFHLHISSKSALQRNIPYLALQTVVENALKHNKATKENPLMVEITVKEDLVIVKNTYQEKPQRVQGKGLGLQYLKRIYDFYKITGFKVFREKHDFICELPLL
ncbi:histidine kinase [Sinomicrobium weinanense]|uniref:Histidine kinase n=1 Tax=Sinomicrobium weinanense TaxID=2842200 RepID=A0A926Q2J5_9FLAO|nr:histidine kinase [Sinomicrobium weinanense]MBC9794996.1 histidine kinase [Sinomicrobium weinanense]MBU3125143.1 histidine kinase [Sinomicrobium weinanense]